MSAATAARSAHTDAAYSTKAARFTPAVLYVWARPATAVAAMLPLALLVPKLMHTVLLDDSSG
jgi:hypothetical protein